MAMQDTQGYHILKCVANKIVVVGNSCVGVLRFAMSTDCCTQKLGLCQKSSDMIEHVKEANVRNTTQIKRNFNQLCLIANACL